MSKRKPVLLLCLWMLLTGAASAQENFLPVPADLEIITAENLDRLRPIGSLGQSSLHDTVWSPDGVTLAAADIAGVWLYNAFDLSTQPRRFIHPTPGINQIAFNSDGTLLVTTGQDGYMRLWEVVSGEMLRETSVSTGTTGVLRFSPDDALLLTNTDDGDYQTPEMIELWDTVTWERAAVLDVEGPVRQAMFSPDGTHLMTVTIIRDLFGGKLRVWDVESVLHADADAGNILFDGDERNNRVTGALFTPDAEWIIAHIDDRFQRWNVVTGEQGEGQDDELNDAFLLPTPYANGIAFVRGRGELRPELALWDFSRGGRIGTISLEGSWGSLQRARAAPSPDGTHYIVVTAQTLSRWSVSDLSQPQETTVYKQAGDFWDQIVFSPDGTLLASVTRGRIDLWDIHTGTLFISLDTGTRGAENVWFSRDGTRLLATLVEVSSSVKSAAIWNVATGSIEAQLEDAFLFGLTPNPDWTLLVGRPNREPEFRLVRLDGAVERVLYSQIRPGRVLAFSPDGRRLATIGDPLQFTPDIIQVIEVWDVASGEPVTTIGVDGLYVPFVVFDQTGDLLFFYVSGSSRHHETLWDIANDHSLIPTAALMQRFRHPQLSAPGDVMLTKTYTLPVAYFVLPLTGTVDMDTLRINNRRFDANGAFSPDGCLLATAHYGGYIMLWGVPSVL